MIADGLASPTGTHFALPPTPFPMRTLLRCLALTVALVGLTAGTSHAQTGTLAGVVVDAESGETLPGANVLVVGLDRGAATDLDGAYRIPNLAAGTYTVRYSFVGLDTQEVTGVQITPGETTTLNIELAFADDNELGMVTVAAEAIIERNTEVGLLRMRARAAQVSDAISAETISQSGASDAADAVERVTGVSVQGGQYVFVRGLGDRYANTQLNGAVLPTADPDRRAVQFDLFPSSFLENIVTLKTFTPDKPGSFSGGLVDISTKSFPTEFSTSLSFSSGFATSAIPGEAYLVDPVQGASPFRFGPGGLALADVIDATPREDFLRPTTLVEGPNGQTQARRDAAASERIDALSNALTPQIAPVEGTLPINGSFGFSLGDQITMGDNALGFILGLTGDQSASFYDNGVYGRVEVQGLDSDGDGVNDGLAVDTTQSRSDVRGMQEATLGGIANLAYRLGSYNEFNLNSLFSHTAESEARQVAGIDNILREGAEVTDVATKYTERTLTAVQLKGEHQLPGVNDLEISWRGNLSDTRMDQPDQRFAAIRRSVNEDGDESFTLGGTPPGPQRYFRDLEETLYSGALDVTLPFTAFGARAEAKVGGLLEQTERSYSERFFYYELDRGVALAGTSGEALADYLAPENVGITAEPEEAGDRYEFGHYLLDATRDQNQYSGTFDVGAAYGMVELPLGPLRAIIGARYEPSRLFVASEALALDLPASSDSVVVVNGQQYLGTDRSYNDLLPALNLVYSLSDEMNLRAAATRTLARPTFREIAPVSSFDIASGGALVGNPALQRTLISNFDLRWEWFNRPGQILAISGFYKDLSNPIERVILDPENGSTTYENVDRATVLGAEFEARQTLAGFGLRGPLADRLALGLNLTVANSAITITDRELAARRQVDPNAADTRDLQGQSPYLLNASLSYDNADRGTALGVFFNVAGRRLSRVGNPLPDVYEAPSPQLDLTASKAFFGAFTLKASAKNVLGSSYREVYDLDQDVIPFQEYNRGTRFSLGLSLDPSFGFARPASASVPSPSAGPLGN